MPRKRRPHTQNVPTSRAPRDRIISLPALTFLRDWAPEGIRFVKAPLVALKDDRLTSEGGEPITSLRCVALRGVALRSGAKRGAAKYNLCSGFAAAPQ